MKRQPVKSSNLRSVGYDEKDKVLEIEFHSGHIYQYSNVELSRYEALIADQSHGKYFDRNIKKKPITYPYVRIK